MTYKLEPWIGKIESPIILVIDRKRLKYQSGKDLLSVVFDKRYLVSSIRAENNLIEINIYEANPISGNASFFE